MSLNCFLGVLSRRRDGSLVRLFSSDLLLHDHPLDGHRAAGVERHHAEAAVAAKRRETLSTSGKINLKNILLTSRTIF